MVNKVVAMFDLDKVKKQVAECPEDEIVILCQHWSINKPEYGEDEDLESYQWDMDDFEEMIGAPLLVNDYDDLVVDPHGILNS